LTTINPNKITIREISKKIAKDMIVKNHYSHKWTSCRYALGIFYETDNEHTFFDEKDEKLAGVAIYGYPVGRSAPKSISPELKEEEVLELTRLFIFDDYGKNTESVVLSKTFSWLKENASDIKVLVSYSDPEQGHLGIIYQATNWIYQGIIGKHTWSFKFNENDRWKHGRTIFPYYGTNDIEKIQRQVKEPFWIRKEPRKHRYIYILTGKKDKKKIMKNLKYPILPYPKAKDFGELEILKMEPILPT